MADCIFCKIVKGDAPSSVVSESDKVIAFKSIDPAASVHILVSSKKHIEEFVQVDEQDYVIFTEMVEVAQSVIKKQGIKDAYKLIFNGGKFPGIRHLHWHVLGGQMKDDLHERI